jgi:hypothetical protein
VALVRTDVSEERIASIIRAMRIRELRTALAVTSNCSMLRRATRPTLLIVPSQWPPTLQDTNHKTEFPPPDTGIPSKNGILGYLRTAGLHKYQIYKNHNYLNNTTRTISDVTALTIQVLCHNDLTPIGSTKHFKIQHQYFRWR